MIIYNWLTDHTIIKRWNTRALKTANQKSLQYIKCSDWMIVEYEFECSMTLIPEINVFTIDAKILGSTLC